MVLDAPDLVFTTTFREKSKEGRAKIIEEVFPRYLWALNKIFGETQGPFLLGEEMTIGDLKLANRVIGINSGQQFDHIPAGCIDEYTHLLASAKAVLAHPKVLEWNAMH